MIPNEANIRKEFIEALMNFSNQSVTNDEANIIADQHLRMTDFVDDSPLAHKGPKWLAKRILRLKNIIS